jgi:hypothetical protein
MIDIEKPYYNYYSININYDSNNKIDLLKHRTYDQILDKFGISDMNHNKIFLNKLEALIYDPDIFEEKGTKVFFHIPNLEKIFRNINLYNEPEETLQELYLQRAIQLRSDYDYVTLFYSGGADSHCILETFMLNNIFIDEIVIYDMVDGSAKKQIEIEDPEKFSYLVAEGRGYEIEKSAIKLAKYFVDTFSPHTKITYFPKIQEEHLRFWENMNSKFFDKNLESNTVELLVNRPVFRIRDTNVFNPEWRKIKQNKRVVHLWGREKPAIRHDNFGFYFYFNDSLFHSTFDNNYDLTIDGLPSNHEYFFIHPNACKLFLKQAHMLVNKLPKQFFYDKERTIFDTRYYQDKISKIIYDFKIQIPYQGLKPNDLLIDYKTNPKKYPNLTKIVEQTGIRGILSWPSIIKFFLENENLSACENNKKFMNFFSNNVKDLNFKKINDFTETCRTSKFYFKKC